MCFRFPKWLAVVVAGLSCVTTSFARDLRVCADPDNLPFSNMKQQGFENRIAELIARDLHANLQYVWQRMGRGFVREYINKGACDVLIGIPAQYRPMLTTAPYYRSTYVFVTRRDHALKPASLNDPALHQMKIGVQALEEEYTPPATALARRGMQSEIVGFDTIEDPESIMRAVADGKVDTAIVWGPLAGYFAREFGNGLQITPVTPEVDPPGVPFTFAISMGVRKGNTALRDELDRELQRHHDEIQKILIEYGVPQLELAPRTEIGG
jgi:quinoprotein dehydrogenase-associated probable ABC transporter substrate-binding protein